MDEQSESNGEEVMGEETRGVSNEGTGTRMRLTKKRVDSRDKMKHNERSDQ